MDDPQEVMRELQEREAEEIAFIEAMQKAREIQRLFNMLGGDIEGTIHSTR